MKCEKCNEKITKENFWKHDHDDYKDCVPGCDCILCKNCDEPATNFHSGCCGCHFEGVIKGKKLYIACEDCGKIQGELK